MDREQSLEEPFAGDQEALIGSLAEDQPSPSKHAQNHERMLALARSMEQLPQAQQEVLVLRFWEGLTLDKIARRSERSKPAVAGLLYRGLGRLQELLAAKEQP